MPKIMFTISYAIQPERRDEYVALMQQMKEHLGKTNGRNYSIFEQKAKKNNFTEVFLLNSIEEYEQLEDQDETTTRLVGQLEELLVDRKMKYSTLIEL